MHVFPRSFRRSFTLVCLLAASSLLAQDAATRPAAGKPWSTDIDQALATASAAKMDTLLWFSGSGWNIASDAVQPALLDPSFMSAAGTGFVLTRADFPAGREKETEVDPAYSVWAERLRVTQLPAVVLIDPSGRPYARMDAPAGDAATVQRLLATLRSRKNARDADLAKAASLGGVERARQLDRGLAHVGDFATEWYKPIVAEIVRLDADNTAGLAAKYRPRLSEANIDDAVQKELYPLLDQSKFAEALILLDRLLADAKPTAEQKQLLLAFKGQVAFSNGDKAKAIQWLDEAYAVDPKSAAAERVTRAKAQIVDSAAPPKAN